MVSYVLSLVLLAEYLLVFPLLKHLIALPFALRAALAVACVLPLGLGMGIFFPSVLERLKLASAAFVPWAWGLNRIFSVVAPVLASRSR